MRNSLFSILAMLLCLLCSCERIMYLDAGGKPQVVVDCILVTEPEQKGSYCLEVRVPGYDLVSAEQTMPELHVYARRINDGFSVYRHKHRYSKGPLRYYVVSEQESFPVFVCAWNYDETLGKREKAEYICTEHETVDDNVTDRLYEGPLYPEIIGRNLHRKYLILRCPGDNDRVEPLRLYISGIFKGEFPYSFIEGGFGCGVENRGVMVNPGPKDGYLEFSRLSREQEKFYECVKEFQEIQESTDMSTIYLHDNIYTNIDGGLGFLGARTTVKMMWSADPLPEDDYEIIGYI